MRSLLEDLPRGAKPVVILRAARREDLALREDLQAALDKLHMK